MSKDNERTIEINVANQSTGQKNVRFVPESEGVRLVESGQASWPNRILSFEEQMHTPMAEVIVPHPCIPNEKAVRFVPKWQADSMIKTGQAESPKK